MEKNKLVVNKTSLFFMITFAILYLVITIAITVLLAFRSLGDWFWLNVRNPIAGFFYKAFELIPGIGLKFGTICVWTFLIASVLLIIVLTFKKLKGRNVIFNIVLVVIPIVVAFESLIGLLYSTSFYTSLIDRFYLEETVEKEYQKEDLVALYDNLLNRVMEMSLEFDRDSDGDIIYTQSIEERAIGDLLNISDDYKFLKGAYPKKYKKMLPGDPEFGGMAMGLTSAFGVSIDYSTSKAILLNTITHELCHTKGVMRENEAVYCSFLAGINSDDKLSQYAAYLEAFTRVDYALRDIDFEEEFLRVEPLFKLCIDENFKEICEIYPKLTNAYVKDAKILEFITYPLIDYKDHVGELIGLLSSLSEDGGKLYIDGAEADMDYVLALIKNDSYKVIRIEFKNSSEVFDNLHDVMNKYSNLFLAIQQYNPDEEVEDKTPDEYLKYYLKGFNNDNLLIDLVNTFIEEDYDYSRVVRLLLEYYDGLKILPYEM
jgi:hypothetical protein